ncbi:MAG: single-stranded DNA-binding protein [Eubacterium sp.]|nr:single-stranded DNA-binding protein [Eubacterium sp.]
MKIFGMGRLVTDPDVRHSVGSDGKDYCITSFRIACNRKNNKGNEVTDYYNCTAFGGLGKTIGNYFTKGRKIFITGRLENNNYEKNGVKYYQDRIIVEEFEFADSNKGSSGGPANEKNIEQPATPEEDGFMPSEESIDEGDLAFYSGPADDRGY